MRRYNIQDVRLLGQLYDRIKAWIKPLPNPHLYDGGGSDPACTVCGGRVKENGHAYLSTGVYKRYKCVEDGCGAHSRSRTTSMSPEDRSGVLVRA